MKIVTFSILFTAVVVLAAPVPEPTPPGIPSASSARTTLASLQVSTPVDDGTYNRSLFHTWDIIHGKCNTRHVEIPDVVLIRDGEDVKTNRNCVPQSGIWTSPYDGLVFTEAHKLDIDHFVPLKNAWMSGASEWTDEQREAFANDLTHPQLWAVSAHANRQKGDKSPDRWKPPLTSFYCTYAESWVDVKGYYNLTISDSEKDALGSMLDDC
ncbi:uncharacterized protein G6M90_00g033670 [Metarhizium brunneum]|uniref:GmrSD restriction endonucleases C-terminal domain-containing protein n=1 Tax=Metarhizium brunneum TaxID=500148 RepID=A0A7D5UUA1_9HYPO